MSKTIASCALDDYDPKSDPLFPDVKKLVREGDNSELGVCARLVNLGVTHLKSASCEIPSDKYRGKLKEFQAMLKETKLLAPRISEIMTILKAPEIAARFSSPEAPSQNKLRVKEALALARQELRKHKGQETAGGTVGQNAATERNCTREFVALLEKLTTLMADQRKYDLDCGPFHLRYTPTPSAPKENVPPS